MYIDCAIWFYPEGVSAEDRKRGGEQHSPSKRIKHMGYDIEV